MYVYFRISQFVCMFPNGVYTDMEESEDVEKDYEELKSTYEAMATEATLMFKSGTSDLEMMAPKKVNWDLKARLAPQMRLLQRQTQRALVELARENVGRSGSLGRNVGNIVATRAVSDDDDDDDEL